MNHEYNQFVCLMHNTLHYNGTRYFPDDCDGLNHHWNEAVIF